MKVLSVFGAAHSGKTTTVENIINELRDRGYSVGYVKEMESENPLGDIKAADTQRHKDAGAEIVIERGLNETDIKINKRLSINEILSYYSQDYVILDGSRDIDIPNKILCAAKEAEIREKIDDAVIAISGIISRSLILYKNTPSINSLTDVELLVDLIEEKVQEYEAAKE